MPEKLIWIKSVSYTHLTGGAGAVGMTFGATQKKDGYTITMITREIVSLPLMNLSPISYKDFSLVSLVKMCIRDSLRPDHGRMIWGETGKPGYGLYDRALGASYITGIWETLERIK